MTEPSIPDHAAQAALDCVAGIPRDAEGPVFGAPWQAQAFTMAVALHERGVFTWADWAAMLGAARAAGAANGAPDTGDAYYRDWLATLERMVAAKGIADADLINRTRGAWSRAADRTPHGAPIELRAEDFSWRAEAGCDRPGGRRGWEVAG
jgi:nitrile hydratase accessory protein